MYIEMKVPWKRRYLRFKCHLQGKRRTYANQLFSYELATSKSIDIGGNIYTVLFGLYHPVLIQIRQQFCLLQMIHIL